MIPGLTPRSNKILENIALPRTINININGVKVIMPEHARITVDFQNCQNAYSCLHPTGRLEIDARKQQEEAIATNDGK